MTPQKERESEIPKNSEKGTDSFDLTEEFQRRQNTIDLLRKEIDEAEEKSTVEKESDELKETAFSQDTGSRTLPYPLDMPYYEIYDLNPVNYSEVKIDSLDFSVRLKKRVRIYKTLENLLKQNDDTLCQIKGFGRACFEELHAYLAVVSSFPVPPKSKSGVIAELEPYKEQLLSGDFTFVDQITLNQASYEYINKVRQAHDVLDAELIRNLAEGRPEAVELAEMFGGFVRHVNNRKKVEKLIREIPEDRLETNASRIIGCFTGKERILQYLQSCVDGKEQTLREYLYANEDRIDEEDSWFPRLAQWCQYDLHEEIEAFFTNSIKNDREMQVIIERANGKTLEEIGKMQAVTRERIRQIKEKVQMRFSIWQKKRRIFFKIFLEMHEQEVLFPDDIETFIGKRGREVVYLLKNCRNDDVTYESDLDLFVMNGKKQMPGIREYVQTLPDTFSDRKLPLLLKNAAEQYQYPERIVQAVIEDTYKKTSHTYHRFRFTLSAIYSEVLKKYYPQGIFVNNKEELNRFRQHVQEDYDLDLSRKSNHSIKEILFNIGSSCGRGLYRLNEEDCDDADL